jgi:hypothetical protein
MLYSQKKKKKERKKTQECLVLAGCGGAPVIPATLEVDCGPPKQI